MCNTAEVPRQKIPKDGWGPRGAPDCYYTSRVLNSTHRYVRFVRKLRAQEEEQRKGAETKAKEAKDGAVSDFFLSCDRRSLINDVARRVDLCMKSYEEDLTQKRLKLKEIFRRQEEENIRKFVVQAQAGVDELWQERKDRLQYLLEKRKKEHEEKYKDTPLSKCAHVLPCITRLRAEECQDVQRYQMREKQARKMAEAEMDRMWHAVAMKEADALAARMEQDAIERYRKDHECKAYSDYQIEQRRIQKEKDRELLKQETLRMKAIWDEEIRKEQEEERARKQNVLQMAEAGMRSLAERQERMEKEKEEGRLVSEAWESLAGQGLADEKAALELRKQKERDLDECNRRLLLLKAQLASLGAEEEKAMAQEASRAAQKMDAARCQYNAWAARTKAEVRQAQKDQIKEREKERELLEKKKLEEEEYERQLSAQLNQLSEYKKKTDAEKRKEHQSNLLKQMEYTNVLKERARQEEVDQIQKYKMAADEYERAIGQMLCRPSFSEEMHPFMKQMAKGMKLPPQCPCSRGTHCK